MKTSLVTLLASGASAVGLLLCGCSDSTTESAIDNDATCRSNLWQVRFALERAVWSSFYYPSSLDGVASFEGDLNHYVCPATNHRPGNITNVSTWTDYAYVGKLAYRQDNRIAMLLCSPSNHGGHHGHVAYLDRNVIETLPADDFYQLIKEPWRNATRLSAEDISELERETVISIPSHIKVPEGPP